MSSVQQYVAIILKRAREDLKCITMCNVFVAQTLVPLHINHGDTNWLGIRHKTFSQLRINQLYWNKVKLQR